MLGFPHVTTVGEGLAEWLSDRSDGDGFDCVFDATGSGKAIEQGFQYVAHGGSYVLISVVKDRISFADPEFHKREMQLIGSRNATREDFGNVIARIRDGSIPTDALQTHSFAFGDMPEVLPRLLGDQGSVLKAIAAL